MPGIDRLSIDTLVRDVEVFAELGLPAIALFPNIADDLKSADGERGVQSRRPDPPGPSPP